VLFVDCKCLRVYPFACIQNLKVKTNGKRIRETKLIFPYFLQNLFETSSLRYLGSFARGASRNTYSLYFPVSWMIFKSDHLNHGSTNLVNI
jgi:hypothetical protein